MDENKIQSMVNEGHLRVRTIIEVVGTPKEHVTEALTTHLKAIKANKNYTIIEEKTEKPAKTDNFFSAFSEIEMLVKNPAALMRFCFDFMPSSVEIIEPSSSELESKDFTDFLNDLQARLHGLNEGIIQINEMNRHYVSNTAVLLRNFIVVLLSEKPRDTIELNAFMGVKTNDIEKVLEVLMKEGKVKKQGELYSVIPKK